MIIKDNLSVYEITAQTIIPSASGYNIGSQTNKWNNGYFSGAGSFGSVKIGNTTVIDKNRKGSFVDINASGIGTFGSIISNGAIKPSTNCSYDIGDADYKWRNCYFDGVGCFGKLQCATAPSDNTDVIRLSDITPILEVIDKLIVRAGLGVQVQIEHQSGPIQDPDSVALTLIAPDGTTQSVTFADSEKLFLYPGDMLSSTGQYKCNSDGQLVDYNWSDVSVGTALTWSDGADEEPSIYTITIKVK